VALTLPADQVRRRALLAQHLHDFAVARYFAALVGLMTSLSRGWARSMDRDSGMPQVLAAALRIRSER
jgi:hypothetical protein